MSYDPRAAERPKGSVRAAREKLQAAQAQQQRSEPPRIVGLPQRPNQLVSQFAPRSQQQAQERDLAPPESGGNGSAFSPTPQWPLPNDAGDAVESGSGQFSGQQVRGTPPQRPPRPFSEDLPIQSQDDYRSSYQSDDIMSPASATPSSRPLTTSSAASEASSLGSIPDFPVPLPPMPVVQPLPRRQPSLGPPPSARRGPPSYYTQMSYVSPIAEESEARSDTIRSHHGSFASSAVFPVNDDDYYQEEGVLSEDDDTVTSDYGRDSRASDHDEKSELVQPALLRQASLGRRTKPSLMTIKSVDSFGEKRAPSLQRKPIGEGHGANATAAGIGSAVLAARDGLAGNGSQAPPLGSGSVLLDASSSSEEDLSLAMRDKAILNGMDPLEKDEFVSSMHPVQDGSKQTLADRVGKRRPPRIDVDAVREAEARGSLTSLPELIRRATRLAANLDRGKTASRLGLDFWESGAPEKARRSGSLSDMLAAFPPPGEATPPGNRTPNAQGQSKLRDEYGATDSAGSDGKQKRRRRCCGMPMWTFVTLLIVLLFLVAAAVVIPVVLIVLPKMRDNQTAASQTSNTVDSDISSKLPPLPAPTSGGQTNKCDGVIRCQNGGVAILNADQTCNCVCINGFTGKACETEGDAACTTINVSGAAEDATLGSNLPRLFEAAESNFSIPLDPTTLLSVFSDLGLSCNTENALVTFNGLAVRALPDLETALEPSKSLPILELPHGEQERHRPDRRQAIGQEGTPRPNPIASATPTARASATARPSTQPISRNATAIDFARIGILLLLQERRQINDAANLQVQVQDFLRNDRDGDSNNGNTVELPGVFEMDLVELSFRFQNGTTLQARPANSSSS